MIWPWKKKSGCFSLSFASHKLANCLCWQLNTATGFNLTTMICLIGQNTTGYWRWGVSPLLWHWRTNINLLQQSIFHHTYSQGTSQSGLYPFCQWLPSSINFIENYTPDRCSSWPLSICRGVVEADGVGDGGVHVLLLVWSDGYFMLAVRSRSDNSHNGVRTKQCLSSHFSHNWELEATQRGRANTETLSNKWRWLNEWSRSSKNVLNFRHKKLFAGIYF